MKKQLILLISAVASLSGGPLFSAAVSPVTEVASPIYNWNYWSYEFGIGAGYVKALVPEYVSQRESLAKDTSNVAESALSAVNLKSYQFPLPDFRFGIEKSWHFAKKMTATFDFALFTPAFTVGYLVSPRTRIYVGAHYAWLLNHGIFNRSSIQSRSISTVALDGTRTTTEPQWVKQEMRMRNSLYGFSPRIGVDTFLSPRTMLRVNLSYDWLQFYEVAQSEKAYGGVHWPQLTICLKKFF